VAAAPEDPLFGLVQAFRRDPSDKKLDLVIGAYRDNDAKPWILPVVKKVIPPSLQQYPDERGCD
jgi:aspartate aminotransferase